MILDRMKNVIKYVIELDIDYLETFLGYEGDRVLKITTKSKVALNLIKKYLDNMDLDYKSEYMMSARHDSNYNIFVGVEDPSVFKLKKT